MKGQVAQPILKLSAIDSIQYDLIVNYTFAKTFIMEFALSQEGDVVKLFIQGIKWEQLYSVFTDEVVTVKQFDVWTECSFIKNIKKGESYYHSLKLRKQDLPFSEIKNQLIKEKPLSKFKWIDQDLLRERYPELVTKGSTASDIWEYHVTGFVTYEGLDANVLNTEFQVRGDSWELKGYYITFFNRERLTKCLNVFEKILNDPALKELKDAAKNSGSFATKKLRKEFELAGNVNRMVRFIKLLKEKNRKY